MLWVLGHHFDGGETIICYFPPIYIRYVIKYIRYLISTGYLNILYNE